MTLYLLTCSKDTIRRFDKSIVNAIFLDDVRTLVGDDVIEQLPSDRFNLWGLKDGEKITKTGNR